MNIPRNLLAVIFEERDGAALTLTTARVVIHVTRYEDAGVPFYLLSGAPLGNIDREYNDASAAVVAALRVVSEYAS